MRDDLPGDLDRALCTSLVGRSARSGRGRFSPAAPKWPRLVSGEQVEDEAFYNATSIAAIRIGCRPGNARNAVAMAAIAANTQADRKT